MRRSSIVAMMNRAGAGRPPFELERLDTRVLMDSAPLPDINDMEDELHTVVRLETNFGDIDIEMLDDTAPASVANFLKYVRDGDYDGTFFHRLVDGFVLQGGRARWSDGPTPARGTHDIPRDDPVVNEFGRTNAQRTIAYAKSAGDPNSATSEWFFNLNNNAGTPPNGLDFQNGGFTVFAVVLDDRSWNVVLDMADSEVRDFGSPYDELPVTDDFSGTASNIEARHFLTIIDAEIIKPDGVDQFYQYKYYYPEGFSGSTINEFIPMANPNGERVYFQAITRAERAQTQPVEADFWWRDKVIFTNSIGPTARRGFTVSTARTTDTDKIFQQGVPYAFEIWSTLPISANLSHYDFGSATGESFSDAPSTTWFLSNAEKDDNVFDFPVWQNVGDTEANVTLTFYFRNTGPVTVTRTTAAFRRGGLNLSALTEVPNNREFAVRIVSTQPIIAALTHYNNGSGTGSTEIGIPGDGSVRGVLPVAYEGTDIDTTIDFVNPNNVGAVVTLTLTFVDSGEELTVPSIVLAPQRRGRFNLSETAGVDPEDRVTIRYSSGSANVYAHMLRLEHDDQVGHPMGQTAATETLFSEGFMDPARAGVNVFETISVYNPNFNVFGVPEASADVTFRFLFTNSTFIDVDRTLAGGERLDLLLHELDALTDHIGNTGLYFYSIQVISNVPIIAQMSHYDLTLGDGTGSGGFGTLGLQRGTIRDLDNLDG